MARSSTSFKPGCSGNPGGTPKEVVDVRELARWRTPLAIDVLTNIATDEAAPGAARVAASIALLDRAWGRAPQLVDARLAVERISTVDVAPDLARLRQRIDATRGLGGPSHRTPGSKALNWLRLVGRQFAVLPGIAILACLLLTPTGGALADDFEDGLAAFNRGDGWTALRLWTPLAEKGDVAAEEAIGDLYMLGIGVPQDFAEGMKWIRKAAEQGSASAQLRLGNIYNSDRFGPKDSMEAAAWYRKAAEQGLPAAQSNLARMYETGDGVPQDLVLAHIWYDLSAAAGNDAAQSRDVLASRMTPEQIAEAQKMARERRAAHPKLPPVEP